MFEINKGTIRSHYSKTYRQHSGQKKKDAQPTKHYTENNKSSNTNPAKIWSELRCSGKCSFISIYRIYIQKNKVPIKKTDNVQYI
jgi:hypothetical protein